MTLAMTRSRLSTAGCVVVGFVGVVWWWSLDRSHDAHDASPEMAGGGASDRANDEGATDHTRTGVVASMAGRYTLRAEVSFEVLAGAVGGLPNKTRMVATGELVLGPAPSATGWLAGRLDGVTITGDEALASRAGLHVDAPNPGIDAPFLVAVDDQGAVAERRFDPRTPAGARNIVGSLLSAVQVVRPSAGVSARWSVDEPGLDGPVRADYEDLGGGRLSKSWRQALGSGGASPADDSPPPAASTVGRAEISRDARGRLQEVAYTLHLRGDLALSDDVPLELSTQATATLSRQHDADMAWATGLVPGALVGDVDLDEAADTGGEQRVPQPSGRHPLAIIEASEAAHLAGDHAARREAMRDLAATLRADAGAIGAITGRLGTAGVDGNELRTLVEALAVARTPQTLEAMATMLEDSETPATARHSLAVGAALMDSPPAGLIDVLIALSRGPLDDVGTAALLGLGLQSNARWTGPQSARVRADLLARAEGALIAADDGDGASSQPPPSGVPTPAAPTLPGHVAKWLDALGNAGGEEVWPLIEPYLEHGNEWVRRAAAGALTYVPGPAPRMALANVIAGDPSPWVRRRAVRTAGNLPQFAFEDALIRALRDDDDSGVRLECARVLSVWGVESPGLFPIIAAAAEREPEAATRQMMEQLQLEVVWKPGEDEPPAGAAWSWQPPSPQVAP